MTTYSQVYNEGIVSVEDVKITDKPANGTAPTANGTTKSALAPADKHWTIDRSGAVTIRYGSDKNSLAARPAVTTIQMIEESVRKFGSRVALKVDRQGTWVSWTYDEYLVEIKTTAKAFIKLGLEASNSVGILGFNAPEWLFSDLGAIFAGGMACGIYTTNNAETCQFIAYDAACNILVVENDAQLQKILKIWDQLPQLRCIVQYTGELSEERANVYTWNQLMEIGRGEDDEVLRERMRSQAPNQCSTLIYTSGTTGNPKGVMLSHDNLVIETWACVGMMDDVIKLTDKSPQEVCVSYLPLSHIAAQITDIWMPIAAGAVVWFAKPDALKGSLTDTLRAARPTVFVGVPRVYEKIEEKLKSVGATITGIKRKIGDWAKSIALKGNQNKIAGKPVPYGWTLAHLLVLKKIHKLLGLDRAKLMLTAAAPISRQTLEYFQSLDVPLLELYGMSETAGALTMNTLHNQRTTSIGGVLSVNEYMIANPDEDGSGELCFRGRNVFMGYLNNEEKTLETVDEEGWIHTGDVGKVDENGFFYITGRIKELIITAGGENIAPVPIEERIKEELPFVSAAMVIGDKKKFLSCFLTLQVNIDRDTGASTDTLTPAAMTFLKEKLNLDVKLASEIAPDTPDSLTKLIDAGLKAANAKAVSNAAKVQKWKLLPLDFTTTGGELGPTQKLRRPHVMKMYKEMVDQFYE